MEMEGGGAEGAKGEEGREEEAEGRGERGGEKEEDTCAGVEEAALLRWWNPNTCGSGRV